ncbi:hypothetical protein ACSLNR_28950, partial [Escherichia coli]
FNKQNFSLIQAKRGKVGGEKSSGGGRLSLGEPWVALGISRATSFSFTRIFFDPKWHLLGDLLHWLAPTAIIQSALSTTGSVF